MSQKKEISKQTNLALNYLYHTFTQLLSIFVPLITTPYVSRVLQPEGIGIYSYTGAVSTFFTLFAALGINAYGRREIAFHRDNLKEKSVNFWELFILKCCTSIIVITVYGIYIFNASNEYRIYYIIQSVALFSALIDISWFFQGIENFRILAIRTTFIRLLTVLLIFAVVKNKNDVGTYILINVGSNFLANVIMFFGLKDRICSISVKELRPLRHLRGVIEFFLPVLAVQLYTYIDKIMLGRMGYSTAQNGYYEQARKITEIVIKIITSINAVLFPRIAFLYAQRRVDDIKRIFHDTFRLTILLLLPIITGISVCADNFVGWFFGDGYEQVAGLLRLSCPLLVFMCIGNFVGVQYLNPTKQQNTATIIYFISAAFNIIFNIILIPKLLSMGALIASNIAEFISCVLQVIVFKLSEYSFRMSEGIWKYIVSSIIMGLVVYGVDRIMRGGMITTVVEILVGIIIYFASLLILHDNNLVFEYIKKSISGRNEKK